MIKFAPYIGRVLCKSRLISFSINGLYIYNHHSCRLTLTQVPASVGSPNNLLKTSLQQTTKIKLFNDVGCQHSLQKCKTNQQDCCYFQAVDLHTNDLHTLFLCEKMDPWLNKNVAKMSEN
jgi:hypothetical protein